MKVKPMKLALFDLDQTLLPLDSTIESWLLWVLPAPAARFTPMLPEAPASAASMVASLDESCMLKLKLVIVLWLA